jgi:AcrR family transcriptional regulator
MYHQFADKTELFAAVFEAVEEDIMRRLGEAVLASGATDPLAVMEQSALAWLDLCRDDEVRRIAVLDGPAVLGWERWRAIAMRYSLGVVEGILGEAMRTQVIAEQPVHALAHVLIGALDEAALYVATAEDPPAARAEMAGVLGQLIGGLRAG